MTTTRAKVVRRGFHVTDEPLMIVEHSDPNRPGPTIGPITVTPGGVFVWLGASGAGEPISIGPGQSIVITCEVDQ